MTDTGDTETQKHSTPYWEDPDYQDWLNELMENAGDEWDGDDAMEAIATRYVRHLEAEVKRLQAENEDMKRSYDEEHHGMGVEGSDFSVYGGTYHDKDGSPL